MEFDSLSCFLCLGKPPPENLKRHLMFQHMIENDMAINSILDMHKKQEMGTQTTVTWLTEFNYHDDRIKNKKSVMIKPIQFKKSKSSKNKNSKAYSKHSLLSKSKLDTSSDSQEEELRQRYDKLQNHNCNVCDFSSPTKFKVDDHIIIHHKNYSKDDLQNQTNNDQVTVQDIMSETESGTNGSNSPLDNLLENGTNSDKVTSDNSHENLITEIELGTNGSNSSLEDLLKNKTNGDQTTSENSIQNTVSELEANTKGSYSCLDNLLKNGALSFVKIPSPEPDTICIEEKSTLSSDERNSKISDYSSDLELSVKELSLPEVKKCENGKEYESNKESDHLNLSLNTLLQNGSITYTKLTSPKDDSQATSDITSTSTGSRVKMVTDLAIASQDIDEMDSYDYSPKENEIIESVINPEMLRRDEKKFDEDKFIASERKLSINLKDNEIIEKNEYLSSLGTSIFISANSKNVNDLIDDNFDKCTSKAIELPQRENSMVQQNKQTSTIESNVEIIEIKRESDTRMKVKNDYNSDSNEALNQLLNTGSFSLTKIAQASTSEDESDEESNRIQKSASEVSVKEDEKSSEMIFDDESDTFCSSDEEEILSNPDCHQTSDGNSDHSSDLKEDEKTIVRFVCPYCDILSHDKSYLDEHIFDVHEVAGRPIKQKMYVKVESFNLKDFQNMKRRNSDDSTNNEKRIKTDLLQDFSEDSTTLTENLLFVDNDTFDSEDELHIEEDKNLGDESNSANNEKPSCIIQPNPMKKKIYEKPPLPSDIMIALAVRNIDPSNFTGASFKEIVAFLSVHFPYYNRNIEECKEIVSKAYEESPDNYLQSENFKIREDLMEQFSIRINSYVKKNDENLQKSLLYSELLKSIVERFMNCANYKKLSLKCFDIKKACELTLISLTPPCSLDQILSFLCFIFPGLKSDFKSLETEINNAICDIETIENFVMDGQKMFFVDDESYFKLMSSVSYYLSNLVNLELLKETIYDTEYLKIIIPNLTSDIFDS